MTIEYKVFTPSEPFDLSKDPEEQVDRLRISKSGQTQILAAGEYNITPQVWKEHGGNNSNYGLIVHENGKATFRVTPNYPDSVTTVYSSGEENSKRGGRTYSIPEDADFIPIIGAENGISDIRIHTIVSFKPGISPKETTTK